jgi:oxygen-independent coproporphyrinogen-3 oxidase
MPDVAALLARNVPRYTSYPTAPHFSAAVTDDTYVAWLQNLDPDVTLSLYLHVPFCDELCLYCGCTTAVVRKPGPRLRYADLLRSEITKVAELLGARRKVSRIHWGGGTPTALPDSALLGIAETLKTHFDIADDAEIAMEFDPRHLAADRLAAVLELGVNRASLGVQDFDPVVQRAIGRIQSFETTQTCARSLRDIGVRSLNLDLIYGLPHQTLTGAIDTAHQALALQPDRLAVFGYAHVPWMKRHQKLLAPADLPDATLRLAQRGAIDDVLTGSGFIRIGLDHYARPDDSLALAAASGRLRRNFQGYTDDVAGALIGFGASAIGSLPDGIAQNATTVPEYAEAINHNTLPIARGVQLSADDRLRGDIIQALMCDLRADIAAIVNRHAASLAELHANIEQLRELAACGVVTWDGAVATITPAGQPYVRSVAAVFDAYLAADSTRHASAA